MRVRVRRLQRSRLSHLGVLIILTSLVGWVNKEDFEQVRVAMAKIG
jgi:hypothetical protein